MEATADRPVAARFSRPMARFVLAPTRQDDEDGRQVDMISVLRALERLAVPSLLAPGLLSIAWHVSACGNSTATNQAADDQGPGTGGADAGHSILPAGSGGNPLDDDAGACAAKTVKASLRTAYLAFALDVSASMGALDYPWHDPVLKWDPVVAATESFFADEASNGIFASLTFFPDEANKCVAGSYATPDVPMTLLPSHAFAAAIAATEFRGGTPTLAVLRGTFEFLEDLAESSASDGVSALVLVTDGYPQGCNDSDNAISAVVAEVSKRAPTIPTYVVGISNPPIQGAPDTVSDLNAIALAGGTSHAFIIETGTPESTKEDFLQVVNGIRGNSISCEIPIPPPPEGQVFDRSKVSVSYTSGADTSPFAYDSDCLDDDGWHYDDPESPVSIVLCPDTCKRVSADPEASINVQFGCEVVIDVVK